MDAISSTVRSAFQQIVKQLGQTFSWQDLTLLTASCRGKPLQFEQRDIPVAITGYCLALRDVDLIVTRAGMDDVLTWTAKLHEMAHLLLRHLPDCSYGPLTPTYTAFRKAEHRQGIVYRASEYDDPQERDAELLATLLLDCITQYETSLPKVARDIYGW
ncbi:MAG TPA: hypothetical protein VH593_04815 [Ktedonobacteraceae bacterium]|jgi:hypothetical protein